MKHNRKTIGQLLKVIVCTGFLLLTTGTTAQEKISPEAAACFKVETIDDATFKRMNGKSFKADCTLPRQQLRLVRILHRDAQGKVKIGEIICNQKIAGDLRDIFMALYEAGYPIERVQMIDDYDADDTRSMEANNTSCFNFRKIAGSSRLSNHSRGMAIDINPFYNPMVRKGKDGRLRVSPPSAKAYADRGKSSPYRLLKGDLCYRLFLQHGFTWGGNWQKSKDYQHFEKE